MTKRNSVLIACAAVLALTAGYERASGATARVNYITFNATMALPGVTLPPGGYAFEIANPETSLRVVTVSSRDGARRYFMNHTRVVRRPATLARDQIVTLREKPAGAPAPIVAWFPIGSSNGYEFIY
jgi:hypothetical protein